MKTNVSYNTKDALSTIEKQIHKAHTKIAHLERKRNVLARKLESQSGMDRAIGIRPRKGY